jgi:hypothetical protein
MSAASKEEIWTCSQEERSTVARLISTLRRATASDGSGSIAHTGDDVFDLPLFGKAAMVVVHLRSYFADSRLLGVVRGFNRIAYE